MRFAQNHLFGIILGIVLSEVYRMRKGSGSQAGP